MYYTFKTFAFIISLIMEQMNIYVEWRERNIREKEIRVQKHDCQVCSKSIHVEFRSSFKSPLTHVNAFF